MNLKESDYFYDIAKFASRFKLDISQIIKFIDNDTSSILSYNCLKYNNTYYINTIGLLYFCYMYRPYKNAYDIFIYLIKYIDDFNNIRNSIITDINDYLIFNNKEIMGFVYIASVDDIIKIGSTSNPITRLKNVVFDIDLVNKESKILLLHLLKFSNKNEAIKKEIELNGIFDNIRIKGGWFNYDSEIDIVITNNYFKYRL
jgi:hypothetical protein